MRDWANLQGAEWLLRWATEAYPPDGAPHTLALNEAGDLVLSLHVDGRQVVIDKDDLARPVLDAIRDVAARVAADVIEGKREDYAWIAERCDVLRKLATAHAPGFAEGVPRA